VTPPHVVGPYVIERELGRGASGVVYSGRHVELKRRAAIKLLLEDQESPEAYARFQRECEALARLGEHPGIVRLYDHGVHEGRPYVSLEFVAGLPLDESLARTGPWDEEAGLQLGLQLCEALEFAHQAGILHRDLKPANVLLDKAGRARLTDFGLAKDVTAESMTNTGQLLGTPSYMPPEQASGDRSRLGPASDVYGLGATLYCVFTGQPPFSGETLANVVTQIFTKPPAVPSSLRPRLNPAIDQVLLRCLAKEPADRFASAAELGAALQAILDGTARVAPSRARAVAILAGVSLLATLGAALALGNSQSDTAPSATQSELDPERQRKAALALGRAKTPDQLRTWLREQSQFVPERRERALSRLAELTFEAFQAKHRPAKAGDDAPPAGEVSRILRHRALRSWVQEHLEFAPQRIKAAARQELSDPGARLLAVFRHQNPKKRVQLALLPTDHSLRIFGDGRPNPGWDLRTGERSEATLLPQSSFIGRLIPERRPEGLSLWSLNLRAMACFREGRALEVKLRKGTAGRDLVVLEDQILLVGSRPRDEIEGVVRRRGFAGLVPRSAFRPGKEPNLVAPEQLLKLDNMGLCLARHPRLPTFYAGGGPWEAAQGREFMVRLSLEGGKLTKPQDIDIPGTGEMIAVSPDGARLAIGLNRGGARIYALDPGSGAIQPERYTRLIPTGKAWDPRVQTRGLRYLSDGRLLMTSKFFDSRRLEEEVDKSELKESSSRLSLWTVEEQTRYRTPEEHSVVKANHLPSWSVTYPFVAYQIDLSPDEALIALGTESFRVVVVATPE